MGPALEGGLHKQLLARERRFTVPATVPHSLSWQESGGGDEVNIQGSLLWTRCCATSHESRLILCPALQGGRY